MLRRFWGNRLGATAIEYGLIATLISIAIVAGVGSTGDSLDDVWADNSRKLDQATK